MTLRRIHTVLCGALLACSSLSAERAVADEPDVDIDKLSAEVWYTQTQWHVGVRYTVEIDARDMPPAGQFYIRLTMTEDDRPVVDSNQRPVQIDVELDQVVRSDDDKVVFRDVLTIDLPRESLTRGERVRLRATVHLEGGRALDRKEVRVKYRYRPPWEE